jgi:ectoine hydroxylase-related dioxygenase (phytanoyl-CoA dioxygenase family)
MLTVAMESALEHRKAYDEQGYVVFRSVLDPDLMAHVYDHIAWLRARHPHRELSFDTVGRDPFWVHLVSDRRLLDIAEAFVGPDIAVLDSHYRVDPPREDWHRDGPPEPAEVVTLWLAVDHSTPENGCVRVIPASHWQQLAGMLGPVDESAAVDLVLAPGDVAVLHPNIIHGANPDTSPYQRRALSIRYLPTPADDRRESDLRIVGR